jgi:hypothetical protein
MTDERAKIYADLKRPLSQNGPRFTLQDKH